MQHFLEEIKDLKNYLFAWFWSFLIISFTIFAVGFTKAEILGIHLHLPIFSARSIAVMFFELIKNNLIPEGVSVIATSPSSAFVSQAIIAVTGAFMLTFPYLLYKVFQFLSPGLYQKEKKSIFKILLPSIVLFLGGAIFAYFILIPPTFKILYSFTTTMGVTPFFTISKFISWTMALMFTTGIMFLLPVFMYILSWIGIISSEVWIKKWKIALVVFLIISAVVTPDGSGVTMVLLVIPMMSLYGIGAWFSKKK